jgi:hypothetical protein
MGDMHVPQVLATIAVYSQRPVWGSYHWRWLLPKSYRLDKNAATHSCRHSDYISSWKLQIQQPWNHTSSYCEYEDGLNIVTRIRLVNRNVSNV